MDANTSIAWIERTRVHHGCDKLSISEDKLLMLSFWTLPLESIIRINLSKFRADITCIEIGKKLKYSRKLFPDKNCTMLWKLKTQLVGQTSKIYNNRAP